MARITRQAISDHGRSGTTRRSQRLPADPASLRTSPPFTRITTRDAPLKAGTHRSWHTNPGSARHIERAQWEAGTPPQSLRPTVPPIGIACAGLSSHSTHLRRPSLAKFTRKCFLSPATPVPLLVRHCPARGSDSPPKGGTSCEWRPARTRSTVPSCPTRRRPLGKPMPRAVSQSSARRRQKG